MCHILLSLSLSLSLMTIASAAHAESVVFEKTKQKIWLDYNVDDAGYYIGINNHAGIVVHISNAQSQPNYVERYDDTIDVPGLSFNPKIGKRGAIMFGQTVCANKTFFSFKDTGACSIDIADGDQTYIARLRIK